MFDDYYCTRCGAARRWEQMTPTQEGTLFCPDCWRKVDPATAARRTCPADGARMELRRTLEIVVVHLCPRCRGMWIDEEERALLKKLSDDNENGSAALMWLWMATGI